LAVDTRFELHDELRALCRREKGTQEFALLFGGDMARCVEQIEKDLHRMIRQQVSIFDFLQIYLK
jgi:hypothetical protein